MLIAYSGQYHASLMERLAGSHRAIELSELIASADRPLCEILVTRGALQIDASLLQKLTSLRLIVKAGSGVDNIDLDAAQACGVRVIRTGGSETSVAELAIGLAIAGLRHLKALDSALATDDWTAKARTVGRNFRGRRVGLIGYGAIGQEVAKIADALGAIVGVWDRSAHQPHKAENLRKVKATTFSTLEELAAWSEIVSVHIPLLPETRELVSQSFFEALAPGAIFINTARAEVVSQQALRAAIASSRLGAVGLDVHYAEREGRLDPIFLRPNVICTPHVGAQTVDTQREMADRICRAIDALDTVEIECAPCV